MIISRSEQFRAGQSQTGNVRLSQGAPRSRDNLCLSGFRRHPLHMDVAGQHIETARSAAFDPLPPFLLGPGTGGERQKAPVGATGRMHRIYCPCCKRIIRVAHPPLRRRLARARRRRRPLRTRPYRPAAAAPVNFAVHQQAMKGGSASRRSSVSTPTCATMRTDATPLAFVAPTSKRTYGRTALASR